MKKIMKKIIFLIAPYFFCSGATYATIDFANEDATLVVGNLNQVPVSKFIITSAANIIGWTQNSIVKNFASKATSWTETFTAGIEIGTGRKRPSTTIVLNNSNAINFSPSLLSFTRNNSQTIVNLPHNSTAIAAIGRLESTTSNIIAGLSKLVKATSNRLITTLNPPAPPLAQRLRTDSNAILSNYQKVKNNSTAAITLKRYVVNNSNALLGLSTLEKANSNAINFFQSGQVTLLINTSKNVTMYPQLITNHSRFASSTTISGLYFYQKGFGIDSNKILTLNTPLPVNGNISFKGITSKISLGGDLYLGSKAYLTNSNGIIDGNGYSLVMSTSLVLPALSTLEIESNLLINGQGNTLIFGSNAQIFLDSNVSLTLKNMRIKTNNSNSSRPILFCLSNQTSNITLDNVIIDLAHDFAFSQGRLFCYNDVLFTGTSRFTYASTMQSYVMPESLLTFDQGTTFYYTPNSTNKDLIQLVDKSSGIYLKGSNTSLHVTNTGFRLTKGRLWLDNKVTLSTVPGSIFTSSVTQVTGIQYGNAALQAQWTPDGRYLAINGYRSNVSNQHVQLYQFQNGLLSLITTVAGPLPNPGNSFVGMAPLSWTTDGRYLAVGPLSTGNTYKIYRFNGATLTEVASFTSAGTARRIEWHPNGKILAIGVTFVGSADELFLWQFNGTSATKIYSSKFRSTTVGFAIQGISWRYDGTYLAVIGEQPSDGNYLRIYSFDGVNNLAQVVGVPTTSTYEHDVSFSPDGQYVAALTNASPPTIEVYRFTPPSTLTLLATNSSITVDASSIRWHPTEPYLLLSSGEIYNFNTTTNTISLYATVGYGAAIDPANTQFGSWTTNGQYFVLSGDTAAGFNNINIYGGNYVTQSYSQLYGQQAMTNGINFGNSALGSSYDLDVFLLAGARIELNSNLFYNNVN